MRIIDGGITAAKGFLATGAHIGIKKIKKDLSLLYSEQPANVAGMYGGGDGVACLPYEM